jgi:oxygen-dependent protoporphyrinogen oxidase
VAVIGGGISGLAAAWAAHEELAARTGEADVVLLEGEPTVGGKARTRRLDEWTLETGPTGFLDAEPLMDELAARAGLEKVRASGAARRRFLVRRGVARQVRTHPLAFALSRVLSPAGLLRLAAEPWVPPRRDDDDESVWDFAARRLGSEAAERLVAPMVSGVSAGDARALSLPAAFPRMRELEREHGSLLRAARALGRTGSARGGPGGPAAPLCSFPGGMETLPAGLARRAPFRLRTGAPVASIAAAGPGSWRLAIAGEAEPLRAEAVVLAADAPSSAALLAGPLPAAALDLAAIPCPGVAVVGLGYGAEAARRIPPGFGGLIGRGDGPRSLGYALDSHLFADRGPRGGLLVRVLLGGATDPKAASLPPEALAETAHADLARLFALDAPPLLREVVRWPAAIPQYELGHRERAARIEKALASTRSPAGGLFLAGNALDGIAFARAAVRGWNAGRDAARSLAPATPG